MTQNSTSQPRKPNARSAAVTAGPNRAAARSYLRAAGMQDADFDKPMIGIVNTWSTVTPCNMHLDRLAKDVRAGIIAAGGYPVDFNTIVVTDGISMGTAGMKASLISREVVADSIELAIEGHQLDGVVCIVGCDKTIPAAAMAAARLDIPTVILYGGTIMPGRCPSKAGTAHDGAQDKPLTVQDVFEAVGAHSAGRIDDAEYTRLMRSEIERVVLLQEAIGLDVLVHGEPERNDMVQYFAEQLDGFFATQNGWVQSYGSRCVRPPILYGDVARPRPMTVAWAAYAQSLTAKPVKGMLTGPVTILAWSFVRDDQPLADTAAQVALAIRDETVDLEKAGIAIIQVDEPALRELLPLRSKEKQDYLAWSVEAFRLATAGVRDDTQIHTHLCYSEFGEVIGAIADLDADVTSIEAARSHMEVLTDLNAVGFSNGVGPGVYDIHSPRVPTTDEMIVALREALAAVPAERLWVNPDCGLKTRKTDEVIESLRNMVAAAKVVRAER